jgi:hypothetical protein
MHLEDLTLALFAASNGLRLFAYIPQIRKAASDRNGASAISYTTWSLFLAANISTVAYALINRADWGLALCFSCNALCCAAILGVTYWKGRCRVRTVSISRPNAIGRNNDCNQASDMDQGHACFVPHLASTASF